ncbi:MAG: peptidoglycan L,D-transpeptidase YkuD family [Acidobacteriaceae bacterium]|nr:peptidoglycan L,D-transpeptidase YkuD family [Acidobacteriaceae bacterium]
MRKALFAALILFGVVSFASKKLEPKADSVLVLKKDRTLQLLRDGKPFKTYKIALGRQPVGAKTEQGDNKTPEGKYIIDSRNEQSAFHMALHVSYPNTAQIAEGKTKNIDPGGAIMVHGLPNHFGWIGAAHRVRDWTQGCIAVTNEEIEEIWRLVPNGTPIEIRP